MLTLHSFLLGCRSDGDTGKTYERSPHRSMDSRLSGKERHSMDEGKSSRGFLQVSTKLLHSSEVFLNRERKYVSV